MNNVDKIFKETSDSVEFADAYLDYLSQMLAKVDRNEIAKFAEVLLKTRENDARIYFIGNGGSAATASHFANDLAIGTRSFDKPFRCVSLCDNQAVITAIGNDNGYENIFLEQLQVLLQKNDVVVAISASGNSENIMRGVEYAKKVGATTVGLTGFDGGRLRNAIDYAVHMPTEKGEYGPVEDGHMIMDHLVSNYLMRLIKN